MQSNNKKPVLKSLFISYQLIKTKLAQKLHTMSIIFSYLLNDPTVTRVLASKDVRAVSVNHSLFVACNSAELVRVPSIACVSAYRGANFYDVYEVADIYAALDEHARQGRFTFLAYESLKGLVQMLQDGYYISDDYTVPAIFGNGIRLSVRGFLESLHGPGVKVAACSMTDWVLQVTNRLQVEVDPTYQIDRDEDSDFIDYINQCIHGSHDMLGVDDQTVSTVGSNRMVEFQDPIGVDIDIFDYSDDDSVELV